MHSLEIWSSHSQRNQPLQNLSHWSATVTFHILGRWMIFGLSILSLSIFRRLVCSTSNQATRSPVMTKEDGYRYLFIEDVVLGNKLFDAEDTDPYEVYYRTQDLSTKDGC